MGLIFWVDENKFVADLIGKVFKKKNLEFYHIATLEELAFRVQDLQPELVVLEKKFLEKNLEKIEADLSRDPQFRDSKFVIKGEGSPPSSLNVVGSLPEKIDPFTVPTLLESILSNSKH
jgi:hypothetical protein